MDYEVLAKLFYKNKDDYINLYQSRFQNVDSTYLLPFAIYDSPAFIVISKEVLSFVEKIYFRNNKLTRLYNQLPKAAISSYIDKSTIEEILLSNDIEGVYSTKKELNIVLKKKSSGKAQRFEGLVKKYKKILEDTNIPLESSEDIKKLYGEIILPEIDKDQKPDGLFFRKNSVSVYDEKDKEIHQGVYPEEKLIDLMDKSLFWLHTADVPRIVRISAFHYLFGYMHPFYDGNGRMSRFISSYLLKETLNFLVSLKISFIISNRKTAYYKAFQFCNDKKNKGDLTPFVITFLDIVLSAIESLIADLSESCSKLDHYQEILNKKYYDKSRSNMEMTILYIIIQSTLFSDQGITVSELMHVTENSEMGIRKHLNHFMQQSLVKREKSGRSMYYSANLDTFDNL